VKREEEKGWTWTEHKNFKESFSSPGKYPPLPPPPQ